MKKIEVISISGSEVDFSNQDLVDELEENEISNHYADTIFRVHKARMPHTHAWLVAQGMITEDQALICDTQVTCCMWGT